MQLLSSANLNIFWLYYLNIVFIFMNAYNVFPHQHSSFAVLQQRADLICRVQETAPAYKLQTAVLSVS